MNVISLIEAEPESIYINTFKGEEGRIAVKIFTKKFEDFKILKVILDDPKIKYFLDPPLNTKVEKDKAYALTVIAPPDLEPRFYNGLIKVQTNIKEQEFLELRYNINVQKLVTVSPDNVIMNIIPKIYKAVAMEELPVYEKNTEESQILGKINKGQEVYIMSTEGNYGKIRYENYNEAWIKLENTKKIYSGSISSIVVQKHKGEDLKIEKVECNLPFIKIETKSMRPNYYVINLIYQGDLNPANYNGTVTIYTNDKEEPVINRPVSITVLKEEQNLPFPKPIPVERKMEIKKSPVRLEEKNEKNN